MKFDPKITFSSNVITQLPTHMITQDQWVILTQAGEKAHCEYHKTQTTLAGLLVGAAALPIAIPAAGVGVAMGGTAMALGVGAQAAVGGAAGSLGAQLVKYDNPVAYQLGKIIKRARRVFADGYDICVDWYPQSMYLLPDHLKAQLTVEQTWHVREHLLPVNNLYSYN